MYCWLHIYIQTCYNSALLKRFEVYAQDYMHELRLCLHTLEQQPSLNVQNRLHQLTFEAIWLRIHSHRLT